MTSFFFSIFGNCGFIFDSYVHVLVFDSLTYFQKIKYKSWFDLSIIRQKIVSVAYILIFKNEKLTQKIHRLQDLKSCIPDPSS